MIPFSFPLPYREPRYTRAELMEVVDNADPAALNSWSNRGQMSFDGGNPGRGQRRLYSAADVLQVAIVTQLTGFCVGVDAAVKTASICIDWSENHYKPGWDDWFSIPSPAHLFDRKIMSPNFLYSGHAWSQVLGVRPNSDQVTVGTFLKRLHGDEFTAYGFFETDTEQLQANPGLRMRALQWIVEGPSRKAVAYFPIGWIINTTLLRILMHEVVEDQSLFDQSGLRAFVEGESGE